jgi:hypothetical protein
MEITSSAEPTAEKTNSLSTIDYAQAHPEFARCLKIIGARTDQPIHFHHLYDTRFA